MRKLTKADLENLAKEIRAWASRNKLGKDWSLFYNGIKLHYPLEQKGEYHYEYRRLPVKEEANPLDYCEWFPEQFIMGMAYDGEMYGTINGYENHRAYDKLETILMNYGLYLEHCDSCHACMCEAESDMEVEYTFFERERIIRLIHPDLSSFEHSYDNEAPEYPKELDKVMKFWMEASRKVGDRGACTIGEYLEFIYEGKKYRMCSQSPYQGDQSWMIPLPSVKKMLSEMGATEIYVNYGRLD